MRPWEATLRRDQVALDDFVAWLDERLQRELGNMLTVGADKHDYQRGVYEGIRMIRYETTSHDQEELARAGRNPG